MKYPKISIITPCFNMEKYIEQTINSIVSQNYPNVEYIIVDGGSTDGTLSIIEKFRENISLVMSEKDDGIYHAIHKGFMHASGDIIAWLNADDIYFPWTLHTVAQVFNEFPTAEWITGLPAFINDNGLLTHIFSKPSPKPRKFIENGYFRQGVLGFLQQESMFWKKELYERAGGLNREYRLAADFELWTRFAKHTELITLDLPLAAFRRRPNSASRKEWSSYSSEVVQAINKSAKLYPNLLWRLTRSHKMSHLLRHLTLGKGDVIYYHIGSEKFIKKKVWGSPATMPLKKLYYQV